MGRVLLVEDDESLGAVLDASLTAQGHEVVWARTARGALATTDRTDEIVLLDLGLPDMDGVEVCRRLRVDRPDALIVMLTARADEIDVVVGLDAGADDYLVKPVPLGELHARLRAHLRRSLPAVPARPIELGDLLVDVAGRRVLICGADIALRPKEFDLLAHLAARAGIAVSRETLMAEVWDENWFGPTKTLDVHVAALRRTLNRNPDSHLPTIVTLRGRGFRLEPPRAAGGTA